MSQDTCSPLHHVTECGAYSITFHWQVVDNVINVTDDVISVVKRLLLIKSRWQSCHKLKEICAWLYDLTPSLDNFRCELQNKLCCNGWGGHLTCSEGFVICFIKVPLACLGSMAAAVQPNSLGNSKNKVNKTFGTSGRPTQ